MNSIYLTVKYPSSSSSKIYTTQINKDLSLSCDCKGWTYLRPRDGYRNCKHTRDLTFKNNLITEVRGEFEYVILDNFKKMFFAYLKQEGYGCDHTIGCGLKFIGLKSTNKKDAEQELQQIVTENYSHKERRLAVATIYEVTERQVMPIIAWYAEIAKAQEQEELKEEIAKLTRQLAVKQSKLKQR